MILNEIDNAMIGTDQVEKIYLGQDLVWENTPPVQDTPFTLEVTSPGDIHFSLVYYMQANPEIDANFNVYKNGVLFDSFNTSGWTPNSAEIGKTWSAVSGDTFEFVASGTNETLAKWDGRTSSGNISTSYASFLSFSGTTATCNVYGNILSLLTNQYAGKTTFAPDFTYHSMSNGYYSIMLAGLFRDITTIGDVSQLKLPSDVTVACYAMMFYGTPIVKAPVLSAATLSDYCYNRMFYGRNKQSQQISVLNEIICYATDISATNCTKNWVQFVSTAGNFYPAAGMSGYWTRGVDGVPGTWAYN